MQGAQLVDMDVTCHLLRSIGQDDSGLLASLLQGQVLHGCLACKAGVADGSLCPYCLQVVDSPAHLWFRCCAFRHIRQAWLGPSWRGKSAILQGSDDGVVALALEDILDDPEVLPPCLRNYGIAPPLGADFSQPFWALFGTAADCCTMPHDTCGAGPGSLHGDLRFFGAHARQGQRR